MRGRRRSVQERHEMVVKKKKGHRRLPVNNRRNRSKPTKKPTKRAKKGAYEYLNEVAYEIVDQKYGIFEVRKTANAWWLDKEKVTDLIKAKKLGAQDETACYYVGITKAQLDYFMEVHDHFSEFFELLKEHPKLKALNTIVDNLKDPAMARWYAERKMKGEFSARSELTGPNGESLLDPLIARARKMSDAELNAEIKRLEKLQKCRKGSKK